MWKHWAVSFKDRMSFYWHIIWHGWWRPVIVLWIVAGVYDFTAAQILPSLPTIVEFTESRFPVFGWRIWAVVGLALLLLATLEGAYRNAKAFRERIEVLEDKAGILSHNGVATRVITVSNYDYEFQVVGNSLRLRLSPEIHAIPGVRVEDIQLEMRGKRYDTDWEPMEEAISGDIGHYVYANLPKSLKAGKYQAKIVACIDNKEYYSDDFTLEYQKPNLDKEGSQL